MDEGPQPGHSKLKLVYGSASTLNAVPITLNFSSDGAQQAEPLTVSAGSLQHFGRLKV